VPRDDACGFSALPAAAGPDLPGDVGTARVFLPRRAGSAAGEASSIP
jgi:hypothetical protein